MFIVRIRCCALLAPLLILAGGCNLAGIAASTVAGGETSPAKFPMAKRPTAVIAENYSNPSNSGGDDEPLARYVSEELKAHKVAPTIDAGQVYLKRQSDPTGWHKMTIAAAGRALGAEQVLYVDIESITRDAAQGSETTRFKGELNIRLIDAHSGATIWPTESSAGYHVSAETRQVEIDPAHVEVTEARLRSELLRMLGSRVARLFYDVKSE